MTEEKAKRNKERTNTFKGFEKGHYFRPLSASISAEGNIAPQ
jgi:hypothetical protein